MVSNIESCILQMKFTETAEKEEIRERGYSEKKKCSVLQSLTK